MYKQLCQLMANVKLKSNEFSISTGSVVGAVFADLFLVKRDLTETEMKSMTETWIDIKDNHEVVDAIYDE